VENIEFKAKVEKPSKVSFLQKIPSKIKSPKILIYALLLVSLPTSVLLVKTVQDIRQRASGFPATPPVPPVLGFGKALQFTNGGPFAPVQNYFATDPSTTLSLKTPYTMEGWIKYTTSSDNYPSTIFSRSSKTQHQYEVYDDRLGLDISQPYDPAKSPRASYIISENVPGVFGTSKIESNKWAHLAVVVSNNTVKLFVNGVLEGSAAKNITTLTNPAQFFIGIPYEASNTYAVNGLIVDEVRLSKIERYTQNFTPSKTPFASDPDTISLWHFDGDASDSASNNIGYIKGELKYVTSDIVPTGGTPTPVSCGGPCTSSSQCGEGACSACSNGVCSPQSTPPITPGMSPTPTPQIGMPIPCGQYGDIDGNYMITSADQKAISQIVAGFPFKDWQIKNADVDGDGKVTVGDSLIVARYLAGLDTTFPVCKIQPTTTPSISKYPTPSPSLYPDLTIDTANGGGLSTSWQVGSLSNPVNVKFRIINQGSVPASAQYIYTNQSEGYSTLGSDNTCTASTILSPGKSCISSYNFVFKSYGTKYFTISIDPYNQIKESIESNNIFDTKVMLFQMSPTPAYGTPPITPRPTLQPTPTYGVPKVTPTPAPKMCPASLNSVRYLDSCRYLLFSKGAKNIEYTCSDKYKGKISVRSCTSTSELGKQASAACAKRKTYCANQ